MLAIVVALGYSLLINFDTTDLPPSWDSATTVSPAALAIVEADFDIWGVAQEPGTLEWGPSTHATSLYTIGLAVLIGFFGASSAFVIAHIVSLLLAGVLAGVTYLFARERLSQPASAVAAVTVSILPLALQQTAEIYLDLPLAIVVTLACWTTTRRRFWATTALVFLGVAIKTSAVFLIPLLLFARPRREKMSNRLFWAGVAGVLALVPFALAFLTTDRFDTTPTLESHIKLLGSAMSLLVLTTDLLIILSVFALVVYGRLRNGNLDRPSKVAALVVVSFLGAHIATVVLTGTITVLPRYYLDVLPVVVATIVPATLFRTPLRQPTNAVAAGFLALLGVFSILNHHGDYYYLRDHRFYVAAERSTRAQDLLALQVEGTRALVDTGLPVVVAHQEFFRVTYPGMGYVEATPAHLIELHGPWPGDLPSRFAILLEPRVDNPAIKFEESLIEEGYSLEYRDFKVGGYDSRLAIVTEPER